MKCDVYNVKFYYIKKRIVMKKIVLGLSLLSILVYAGVNKIRSNGYISGVQSYQVTCTSGSTYIIYKKSGTWYRGDIGHMGNKYNSWSTNDVASYVCN